jgi:Xaa-Pro aminopeptidase
VLDPEEVLGPMRRRKDKTEIELMRKSAQIAAASHIEAMKSMKPGMNEREIQGIFYQKSLSQNARDVSYNSICAGGDNATTLHYNSNDQELKDGDLFLIDAGAEYKYYASDITRTYPVNGKFSEAQKEVYQAVLTVQKNMIDRVKPGVSFQELNEKANAELTQAMVDIGLLKGNVDDLLKENKFKKYYPHTLGHYLGLDVHDTGPYLLNKESCLLEEGVVLTIEPGLYIPLNDDEAPKKFLGIGIRIEDDILVTSDGCEVLSCDAPKEIKDIEDVMS